MGNPMTEFATWDHTRLLTTRHKRTQPAFTTAIIRLALHFFTPEGWKAELT